MKLEKITRYTLYIGLNDKDAKVQLIPSSWRKKSSWKLSAIAA